MKGHLVIHVGGYKVARSNAFVVFGNGRVLPDRMVPADRYEPESIRWYEDGWAVGDNSRDRFCKYGDPRKMRRFQDYDEAVEFIHRLRQKRKAKREEYRLVYVVTDQGVAHSRLVSSMDDIEAIDTRLDREERAREARMAENFPALDRLRALYPLSVATTLSRTLADILSSGIESAAQGVSRSTYYRRLAQLRAAGVLPETQHGKPTSSP